mgnify:CR=1 FL=1
MRNFLKPLIAGGLGLAALSAGAAWAHKPDPCRINHDHRSHAADYYNYYPGDRYSRSGPYRSSGVTVSISLGDHDNYRRARDDRSHRQSNSRTLKRRVFNTRYNANIILTEEVVRTRRGPHLICTVDARGPQARYVKNKHLRTVARENCSRRAQVRIVT